MSAPNPSSLLSHLEGALKVLLSKEEAQLTKDAAKLRILYAKSAGSRALESASTENTNVVLQQNLNELFPT